MLNGNNLITKKTQIMRVYLYIFIALLSLYFAGCQDPDTLTPTVERNALTSLNATFTEGKYMEGNDNAGTFTLNITDPSVSEYVIEVPWYYPENTDELTDITRMRLRAELGNNCTLSPGLGIVDLTKDNYYTLTYPDGSKRQINIKGSIYKLRKCEITYFAVSDVANDIEVTGSINNETGVITLISPDDLSNVAVDMSVSPHATFSPSIEGKTFDFNSAKEFTVTAHDGVTKKTYTVKKEVPDKISYGFVEGSQTDLWAINPVSVGLTWGSGNTTLAAIKNHLIVSAGDGTAPVYLNRMTGVLLGKINMGSAKATGCVTNDDNNNLLIVNEAAAGQALNIYRTNSVTATPTLFLSWTNTSGLPISRVVVRGNIDGNAVVLATCDGVSGVSSSSQVVRWDIAGGVIGAPQTITFSNVGGWGGGTSNTRVVPLSTTKSDGYFLSYYSANTLYHVDGSTNAGSSKIVYGDGSSWGYNLNRLDVRVFNNARYLTMGLMSHFPQWGMNAAVYLYDVTSLSILTGDVTNSPALVYKKNLDSNSGSDGISANGDVILVPSTNGFYMHLYYWDNNTKMLGATSFNCIDQN